MRSTQSQIKHRVLIPNNVVIKLGTKSSSRVLSCAVSSFFGYNTFGFFPPRIPLLFLIFFWLQHFFVWSPLTSPFLFFFWLQYLTCLPLSLSWFFWLQHFLVWSPLTPPFLSFFDFSLLFFFPYLLSSSLFFLFSPFFLFSLPSFFFFGSWTFLARSQAPQIQRICRPGDQCDYEFVHQNF